MFDKYGEFDSAEEMNRAAAAQLAQGDDDAILGIARENGLEEGDAQDYIDGIVPELATPLMAADGKLKVEAEDLEIKEGVLAQWTGMIRQLCTEDPKLCHAVRRKGKQLKECMALMIQYSFDNKVAVSRKILNITEVHVNGKLEPFRGPLHLGYPDNAKARKLIREYYLGAGK